MNKSRRSKNGPAVSFYSRIKEYERILKSGGSFASGVTIYGNDKGLVIVTTDGIGESIKYIELRNIRAVLIKHVSMVPGAVVLTVTLLAFQTILYLSIGEISRGFILSSLFIVLFFLLIFLGLKNCSLRIVTDVNDHLIPCVHKYKVARKLLDYVTEHMQPYLAESIELVQDVDSVEFADQSTLPDTVPEPPISSTVSSEASPPVADDEEPFE